MAVCKFRVWASALAIGIAAASGTAAAKPPSGSYLDSCTRESVSEGTLRAFCEREQRRDVWAKLEDYSGCVGDIANHDGALICLRRSDVPAGDWKDSCINPHLAAPGVFAAVCKKQRRGWLASQIALDKCPRGITNLRGQLSCVKEATRPTPATPLPPTPSASPRAKPEESEPAPPAPPPQNLPSGSYQTSCRELEFDGRYLSGECRDKRDRWQETSLDTKGCARDQEIGSSDGVLVCTRSADGRQAPPGPYQQTCSKLNFDGRFLRGECQDAKGRLVKAILDTRTCKEGDDIVNEDGEVTCRRPQPPTPTQAMQPAPVPAPLAPGAKPAAPATPPAPSVPTSPPPPVATGAPPMVPATPSTAAAGSSQAPSSPATGTTGGAATRAITLYDKQNFSGASRRFTGDAPDLAPLGWDDLAASVQVRGIWQVCEDPNYSGLCANVSEDEPNLAELRLLKQISSFRHVQP